MVAYCWEVHPGPRYRPPRRNIGVVLAADLFAALRADAVANHRTLAKTVRLALQQYVAAVPAEEAT